jgi:hypothetical protein
VIFLQVLKLSVYREKGKSEDDFYFSVGSAGLPQNDPLPAVGLSTKLSRLLRLVRANFRKP